MTDMRPFYAETVHEQALAGIPQEPRRSDFITPEGALIALHHLEEIVLACQAGEREAPTVEELAALVRRAKSA
ncbi:MULTISPECIES: hypothetical protein [unclassified Cupriavidus]|uniref:hypothetical protein n=1 Tax=unclassified Cupriavidus TaxID=2640874 RepID=UPI001BFFE22D|nr:MULTISPECIES: hypothetical protein [unclassified Cupriavidus]MCA3182741.1 hypothetical protein [Cupriavidus sp.]MCA3189803.1 hypothetical protein [Cupriavidus sp.]MCA3196397.1 hypothetical protein [Cupriavidus sp.]MCA3202142.1 hypothetical protein [Cupriavidus sp.]QWE93281.1 hypothetical protein KLP38_09515 [Cupriavidus sp. EM10]